MGVVVSTVTFAQKDKADNGERQRAMVSNYSIEDNEGKNRCRGETKDKYSGVEHYRGERAQFVWCLLLQR